MVVGNFGKVSAYQNYPNVLRDTPPVYVIHISYLSRRKGDPGYRYNTKTITKTAGPVQVCYII